MTLLDYACTAAIDLKPNSKGDNELLRTAVMSMAQRGFMSAVADAARGMSAIAAYLSADAAGAGGPGQEEPSRSALGDGWINTTNAALAHYAALMVQMMVELLAPVPPAGGRSAPSAFVSQVVSQLVYALAETQLLAAVASAVVDSPHPIANSTLPPDVPDMIYGDVRCASVYTATAMFRLAASRSKLITRGGRDGRRLAAVLLRMARHEAVQRLQVALLDQLAAHAGLGAELEPTGLLDQLAAHAGLGAELGPTGEEGQVDGPGQQGQGAGAQGFGQRSARQQQKQQQQQRQEGPAEAWTGSSGAWWFAREEAKRGQLLGLGEGVAGQGPEAQVRSSTAGWLEDYHCHIVFSTLCEWSTGAAEVAEAAGVPSRPPPLLTARLAARAAEALCRLCRGEGLEGAYAPAPEWQFATSEVGRLHFDYPVVLGILQLGSRLSLAGCLRGNHTYLQP